MLRTLIVTIVAALGVLLCGQVAMAEDHYLAVKAPAGMAFVFAINGGSKTHPTPLLPVGGKIQEVRERTSQGFYVFKIPSTVDVSKIRGWCATVTAPADKFDTGNCPEWLNGPPVFKKGFLSYTLVLG